MTNRLSETPFTENPVSDSAAAPTDTFSERDFRDAMGSFATGICVMGARRRDGQFIGMTVNSFSSVSLAPPLVLVCLGAHAPRSQAIIDSGRFSLSVLANDQEDVSNHFAKPGEGLTDGAPCRPGENGAPLVDNAAAHIECDIETVHEAGDHMIVIGHVTRVATDPDKGLLMYVRGRYHPLDSHGD